LYLFALALLCALGSPSRAGVPITTERFGTLTHIEFSRMSFVVTVARPQGALLVFNVQNAYPAPVAVQVRSSNTGAGPPSWQVVGDFSDYYVTSWGQGGASNDVTARDASFLAVSGSTPNPALNVGDIILFGQFTNVFRTQGNSTDVVFPTGTYEMFLVDQTSNRISTNAISGILPGDYNDSGAVDAADYVVWRKTKDTTQALSNDPFGGTVGEAQFDLWRRQFGRSVPSGQFFDDSASVPEPLSFVLALLGGAGFPIGRRRIAERS
jgi:hypothetical protein